MRRISIFRAQAEGQCFLVRTLDGRAGVNGNARKHQRMRARNWRATGTGVRKRFWKLVRKHERARARNGCAGVNGIARRQQRVRAWSGLVSINGRARQRVRAWSWRESINGRARGARERGRESISSIFKFKSSLKSSVVCARRGGSRISRCTLHQRQEQQGRTTTATCYVAILSQARVEGLRRGMICVLVSGGHAEIWAGWLPTNTIYCPIAHPSPMPF